jgi:hypothetical protein
MEGSLAGGIGNGKWGAETGIETAADIMFKGIYP